MAPPILNERRRDERQSRDARMRNERPSASGCAAGGQALAGVGQSSAASGQLNAKQLNSKISHASGTDELLSLFARHSTSLNHIHAANLWNKLGKQRIERRHEEQLERLVQRTLDLVSSCEARNLANIAHGVARCDLQVTQAKSRRKF